MGLHWQSAKVSKWMKGLPAQRDTDDTVNRTNKAKKPLNVDVVVMLFAEARMSRQCFLRR